MIVQTVSWRWVFLINVPLAAVTVALAVAGRGEDERTDGTLDARSRRLGARRRRTRRYQLRARRVAGARARSRSRRSSSSASQPRSVSPCGRCERAIPWSHRRSCGCRASRRANLVTLVMYAALGAHLLFLPVYLQFLGFSPTLAGLVFAPPSIGLILLAPRFGRYADRNGPRLPIAVGRGDDRRLDAAPPPRLEPPGRVDVGRREHLPVRDRVAGGRRPRSQRPRSLPLPRISRGWPRGSTRRSHASAASSPSPRSVLSRAGCSSTRAARATRRSMPRRTGVERAAGVDTFHAVVLCVAGLAFLASALAATFLRGHRQRSTPSSVSNATLRSSPPA